jgi:Tat protein translocase TatC
MTATSAPKQAPEEKLTRMSFGEHLEELRGRLFKALGAVLLGVVALVPFKHRVTEVYIAPYRKCWFMHYENYVAKLDERIGLEKHWDLTPADKAAVAAKVAEQEGLWRRRLEFNLEYRDRIRNGKFEPALVNDIETQGGFPLSYNLKATGGLDDIWIFMSATMLFGVILASPIVIWQVWAFVAAGLYQKERKVVWTYLPFGTALLATGVLFGYYLAVPFGYYMLVNYMELDQVGPLFNVSHYFSFFFSFCTALGLVFQLPLVMLVVNKIGLVSHAAMRKSWRYVILGICFVSMIVTPPDPFSMLLMATPMVLLYMLGLALTALVERKGKVPPATAPAKT